MQDRPDPSWPAQTPYLNGIDLRGACRGLLYFSTLIGQLEPKQMAWNLENLGPMNEPTKILYWRTAFDAAELRLRYSKPPCHDFLRECT
jgi:hypothetical protein